jgi:D-aminopeptidase
MTRLRDLGLKIGRLEPGPVNAITDVAGVHVGHSTIIEGSGPLVVGKGPIRTGVTIIDPRSGSARRKPVFAGVFTLNGNGDMTGLEFLRETGLLTTPIGLTNTHSIGVVRDALVAYEVRNNPSSTNRIKSEPTYWSLPVVAETYDGRLNDIDGQHVTDAHVLSALASATSGPVAEGNVGGGTGMICHGFKGGIGTSSRIVASSSRDWVVGVLVQANYGRREDLRAGGIPIGQRIPVTEVPEPMIGPIPPGAGSIIIVVATDAPLLPLQCSRLARGAAVGLSRVGGGLSDASGDIMIAFATGNSSIPAEFCWQETPSPYTVEAIAHQMLDPLLEATSDATEEAILNALLGAETMIGRDGFTAHALDPERLRCALQQVSGGFSAA